MRDRSDQPAPPAGGRRARQGPGHATQAERAAAGSACRTKARLATSRSASQPAGCRVAAGPHLARARHNLEPPT